MNARLTRLLLRWLILALGVMIATRVIHGIRYDDGATLIVVVLLLSLFNAVLRPLLVLFTLPFILVTMGLGIVLINAFLFLLVGKLVAGFYVSDFWAALGGSLVLSATNFVVSYFLRSTKGPRPPPPPAPPREGQGRGDVIDI